MTTTEPLATADTNAVVASPFFEDEHVILSRQMRRFVETEIIPAALAWEMAGDIPRSFLQRMGSLGLLGATYPERFGGADMDVRATVIIAEALGRSTFGGVAITALVHTDMASVHLLNAGTEEQKQRWLPAIIAGDMLCAVAVTEPDAGSDVKAIRTRAVKDGDSYVLNGRKMFITNGSNADLVFVAAKTNNEAQPSRSVTIFAVEKGMQGFSVASKLQKHGWRSSDTAELVFDDCRVPDGNVIGTLDHGFYAIMQNFQNERIVLAAMAMGEAQAAIELTLAYVKQRSAFGKPLWDKQAIRQRIAVIAGRVEAARSFIHLTAWQIAHGKDCTKEVSMLKALCGELVNEVMYECVQFHGGMGFMTESTIERMSRDARVHAIGGGATEVMLEEVAKRL